MYRPPADASFDGYPSNEASPLADWFRQSCFQLVSAVTRYRRIALHLRRRPSCLTLESRNPSLVELLVPSPGFLWPQARDTLRLGATDEGLPGSQRMRAVRCSSSSLRWRPCPSWCGWGSAS